MSNYNYRVYPKLGKRVCAIFELTVCFQPVLIYLINISFQIVCCCFNQDMLMLKTFTIENYAGITMIGLSWIFGQQ